MAWGTLVFGFGLGELLQVGVDEVGQFVEDLAPLGRASGGPLREGLLGSLHRHLHLSTTMEANSVTRETRPRGVHTKVPVLVSWVTQDNVLGRHLGTMLQKTGGQEGPHLVTLQS